MATKTAGSTVIDISSHPSWRAAERRSREIAEAMQRHPAFQSRLLDPASAHGRDAS